MVDFTPRNVSAVVLPKKDARREILRPSNILSRCCQSFMICSREENKEGKEKSSWFRKKVDKFINDHEAGLKVASDYGYGYPYMSRQFRQIRVACFFFGQPYEKQGEIGGRV